MDDYKHLLHLTTILLSISVACTPSLVTETGVVDFSSFISTVAPGRPPCPDGTDFALCDVERAVSLCNDIVVRLPALSLELKKKETRRRNIGSAITIGIGAAGAIITASIASTQEADGMNVDNKNATIISAGVTGASSVAAAVTTVIVGNGFSDQIELARKTTESIATESAKLMSNCNIDSSPMPQSCVFKARQLQEFCLSAADAVGIKVRPRHDPRRDEIKRRSTREPRSSTEQPPPTSDQDPPIATPAKGVNE